MFIASLISESHILLASATLAFLSLSLYLLLRRRNDDVSAIPRPPGGHWLWGHERTIFHDNAGAQQCNWFDQYGPITRHKGALFHPDIISIADPRTLHHVLTENQPNYVKSPFLRPLVERLMGHGLVWAEGDYHKQLRKLVAPAFAPSNIKTMAPVISDCASVLRDRLAQVVQAQNGSAVINAGEWASSFTIDTICKLKFNHDARGGNSPEAREILEAWADQINVGLNPSAFYGIIVLRAFPFISRLPLRYFDAQSRIKNVISRISRGFVNDSRVDEKKDRTLMGLLLKKSSDGSTKLSMQDIIDNISTFVIGGHETTSGTLQIILYYLAKHPDIQDRLRAELISFGREPDYDDLNNSNLLTYLDAVVTEGLRIHPTGGTTDRVALTDDVLPLSRPIMTPGGKELYEIRIKAGQLIQLPMNAQNTTRAIWRDGKVFKPERWLDQDMTLSKEGLPGGWSNMSTFGQGPRMCIGFRLAILEIKISLAMLIRNFVFYDTGVQIETRISTTVQTRVVGKEEEGIQLPLRVEMFDG